MTNFEKVTSTKEALVEFLDKAILSCPPSKDSIDKEMKCRCFETCKSCWLTYLNQEVSE